MTSTWPPFLFVMNTLIRFGVGNGSELKINNFIPSSALFITSQNIPDLPDLCKYVLHTYIYTYILHRHYVLLHHKKFTAQPCFVRNSEGYVSLTSQYRLGVCFTVLDSSSTPPADVSVTLAGTYYVRFLQHNIHTRQQLNTLAIISI